MAELKPGFPHTPTDGAKRMIPRDPPTNAPTVDINDVRNIVTSYLGDKVFADRFVRCIELIKKKNADYTQGVEKRDRIAAFRRIGGDIDVPMRKVWAIFAQKHWGAVMKYVKDGVVESEPIGGRIDDLINYFVLLGAILDDEKELADMAKYGA